MHGEPIGKLELVVRHNPNDETNEQIATTTRIKEYVRAAEDFYIWGAPNCAVLLINNKTYVLSNLNFSPLTEAGDS